MNQLTKYSPIALVFYFLATHAVASNPTLRMCSEGGKRVNCVVDGDTLWLKGRKIRLEGFDTPEPRTNVCGGSKERRLARKASKRLLQLLNGNQWTIEFSGSKGGFGRDLATIRIKGRDVGNILIDERLARRWPDGDEWWCQ